MNNDLISRSALKKVIEDSVSQYGSQYSADMLNMWALFSHIVNDAPTVERPRGEWIEDSYAGIHCSECDYFPLKDVVITIYADGSRVKRGNWNLTPYCPNCGVKMGREEDQTEDA